jgi:copper resistance protein D
MTFLFALIRAMHFGALMVAFGGNAYLALIRKLPDARPRDSGLRVLFGSAAGVALLTALASLCLTAGLMNGDWHAAYDKQAVLAVVTATTYGHVFLARLPLLIALVLSSALTKRPSAPLDAVLACASLVMLALTSHAAASGPGSSLMAANDALHLLCAGFWIGGLSVLALIVVERRPGLLGALGVFSLWGTYAVFLLMVAGTVNALGILRGPFASLSRTYLTVLTVKIFLATLMIALALANRFRLTPAIHAGDPGAAGTLRWSVATELTVGAVVVFLGALLGLLPYGAPA